MGRPTDARSAVLIRREDRSIRIARVGSGPLVQVWIHEDGNGGRGIILDMNESVEFVEGYNDLLDEIEGVSPA